ncbi:hypothetical protein JOF56_007932 [Kibdelosporangium banguiense]|uniref:Uncharacterized protein n=1 Tax=Kibdelosporangium banguiense TaxID=1365924 RepID=A0ABS4TT21_9PSEU|nr:hypothetical protein [Kibdelosporangium banguiense]MBP2327547.1 hypothetical protein [Kibdelosporangium banguiense]
MGQCLGRDGGIPTVTGTIAFVVDKTGELVGAQPGQVATVPVRWMWLP